MVKILLSLLSLIAASPQSGRPRPPVNQPIQRGQFLRPKPPVPQLKPVIQPSRIMGGQYIASPPNVMPSKHGYRQIIQYPISGPYIPCRQWGGCGDYEPIENVTKACEDIVDVGEFKSKNENNIRVLIVLDETGSMTSTKQDAISAYNAFLTKQQTPIKGEDILPKFTLIKFDRTLDILETNNILDSEPLTDKSYQPSGATALYDAIGCTINAYKEESYNILAILTDGEENASHIFRSSSEIKKLTDKIKTDKKWKIHFLAANIDNVEVVGQTIGGQINTGFQQNAAGYKMAFETMNRDISIDRAEQYAMKQSETD